MILAATLVAVLVALQPAPLEIDAGITSALIGGGAALAVAVVAGFVTRRGDRDSNSIALIKSYADALKASKEEVVASEAKALDCSKQLAEVRRSNWDLEERVEKLERASEEREHKVNRLQADLHAKTAKADALERQVETLTEIIDRRGTPRDGMQRPPA